MIAYHGCWLKPSRYNVTAAYHNITSYLSGLDPVLFTKCYSSGSSGHCFRDTGRLTKTRCHFRRRLKQQSDETLVTSVRLLRHSINANAKHQLPLAISCQLTQHRQALFLCFGSGFDLLSEEMTRAALAPSKLQRSCTVSDILLLQQQQ